MYLGASGKCTLKGGCELRQCEHDWERTLLLPLPKRMCVPYTKQDSLGYVYFKIDKMVSFAHSI